MKYWKGKHGPLLIAEIGGNHEGDFAYAKKLAQLAIEADVDFIKFQIYTGDTLVSQLESPQRNRHFKKFELTEDQHLQLARLVLDAGVRYTSSVWDISAMQWIDKYIEVYKIGSGDITAFPFLKKIAQKSKPLIISTGLSTENEVLEVVNYLQSINSIYLDANMLALLQCTSMYPSTPEHTHLSVMSRYKELTNLAVGYSDHTEGSKALQYAVAMGAEILEFHFTDSREGKIFRDHKVSLTKTEVKTLIEEIKLINKLKGNNKKHPVPIEIENGHVESFRRAVYPLEEIKAGEVISEKKLTTLRPNHGIDARYFDQVVGKISKIKIKKHQKLSWEMFE